MTTGHWPALYEENMEKINYIEIAIKEIKSPEFAHTKQILEVNEIEQENGQYKIEDIIENDTAVNIYFKIKDENYFFCISISKETGEVVFPSIRNSNYCYFFAISESKSLEELASYTSIKYTSGYSKGEVRKAGNKHKISNHSCIKFDLLKSKCYETEEAIEKLLDELGKDKEGIKNLIENSSAIIEICKYQYVSANAGFSLSKELIKKLNDFQIGIDIDTYICGKKFIS